MLHTEQTQNSNETFSVKLKLGLEVEPKKFIVAKQIHDDEFSASSLEN